MLERLEIIRPALEKHVSQAQVARTHQLSASTVQLWIKRDREKGLAGLANAARSQQTQNEHAQHRTAVGQGGSGN